MKKFSISLLLSLTLLGGLPVKGMLPESTAGRVALAAGAGLGLHDAYRTLWRGGAAVEPVVAADVPAVDLGLLLVDAAQQGDAAEAARLIAAGADVNRTRDFGWTALMWAADSGHTEIVPMLLAVDSIEVNRTNDYSWSALICAARGGHAACVSALLRARATVPADLHSRNADIEALLDLGRRAQAGDEDARAQIEQLDVERYGGKSDRLVKSAAKR